jgi:hypothetical protein
MTTTTFGDERQQLKRRILAVLMVLSCSIPAPASAQVTAAQIASTYKTTESATRAVADRALVAARGGGDTMAPLGTAAALQGAELGPAIPVYFVPLDRLRAYVENADPMQLLMAPTSVIYPVMNGSRASSLIEVSQSSDDRWSVSTRGRAALAASLAERARTAPGPRDAQLCVWVAALNQRFFGSMTGSGLQLAPLENSSQFDFQRGVSLPATTVFLRLRAAARQLKDGPGAELER